MLGIPFRVNSGIWCLSPRRGQPLQEASRGGWQMGGGGLYGPADPQGRGVGCSFGTNESDALRVGILHRTSLGRAGSGSRRLQGRGGLKRV